MPRRNNGANRVVIIALIAMCGLSVYQYIKLSEFRLQNESYNDQIEQLKKDRKAIQQKADSVLSEIKELEQINDSLLKAYLNTPTDEDVIKDHPVIVLDTNSTWSEITRAFNAAYGDSIVRP